MARGVTGGKFRNRFISLDLSSTLARQLGVCQLTVCAVFSGHYPGPPLGTSAQFGPRTQALRSAYRVVTLTHCLAIKLLFSTLHHPRGVCQIVGVFTGWTVFSGHCIPPPLGVSTQFGGHPPALRRVALENDDFHRVDSVQFSLSLSATDLSKHHPVYDRQLERQTCRSDREYK